MKQKLYIETSFVSYLTARPSRDLIVAAQQQVTHDWWENRRSQFEIFISQLVVQEAEDGNEEAAAKRLKILKNISLLDLREEALNLAEKFVRSKALPVKASEDALHIANAEIQKEIFGVCIEEGYELMGG